MRNTLAILLLGLSFAGCAMISAKYIPSMPTQSSPKRSENVLVFYDRKDVPFEYVEIGRVFLKNINYWADRAPGAQIEKIKGEAAHHGADAVIVLDEKRREASGVVVQGSGGFQGGDVYQYSGIAIIKKPITVK